MSDQKKTNPIFIKIAICAIAALGMGSLAASAGLAYIAQEFPEVPEIWIQLLVTGPVLMQVPVGLAGGWLSTRISKKTLVLISVLLFTVCGVTPFFIHVFPVIFVLRILYGAAIGITGTVGGSLGYQFFESNSERADVFGLSGAFGMLGGMFYTYVGGQLSELGWQYCFLAYLIGVPIFLIVLFLLPETGKTPSGPGLEDPKRSNYHIHPEVVWIAFVMLIYMMLYFTYTNNISAYVVESTLGGSSEAGLSYSIVNGCGFFGGLMFSGMFRRIKYWVMPAGFAVTTLGFFVLANCRSLPVLFLGSVLIGVSIAWLTPMCSLMYGEVTPADGMTFTLGVTASIMNLGQILSSFAMLAVTRMAGITTKRGEFLLTSWEYVLITLIVCIYIAIRIRRRSGHQPV